MILDGSSSMGGSGTSPRVEPTRKCAGVSAVISEASEKRGVKSLEFDLSEIRSHLLKCQSLWSNGLQE
jgi:hypothetical protein